MSKKIISKKEFQEMYPRYNTESKWKTIVNRIKASEYADAYVRISRNDVTSTSNCSKDSSSLKESIGRIDTGPR